MTNSHRTAIALALNLGFAAIATLAVILHWRHLFWVLVVCFALVAWATGHRQLVRGRVMSRSQEWMIGVAGVFAIYGAIMLAVIHDWRDGLWALGVCAALVWGAIEHRARTQRAVVPDTLSQLKLL